MQNDIKCSICMCFLQSNEFIRFGNKCICNKCNFNGFNGPIILELFKNNITTQECIICRKIVQISSFLELNDKLYSISYECSECRLIKNREIVNLNNSEFVKKQKNTLVMYEDIQMLVFHIGNRRIKSNVIIEKPITFQYKTAFNFL